ncbi:MAG: hypothetical protein JXA30_05575 [Deltaproteobacteria bacterium]|nr:hypothetical protein [Deltaproteobacteria bacterium]
MRRVPWRWIIFGAIAFFAVIAVYRIRENQKAAALRAQIIQVHEKELKEVSNRYRALRDRIEDWIIKASNKTADNFIDPRLNINGLRKGKGLYLRIRFGYAVSKDKIAEYAVKAQPDAIAQCLGLEPAWARELYEKGQFLMPQWLTEARRTNQVMRLRVIDDELALRIRRDLPRVVELLKSDWFLLVLQHGETRHDEPVDVFLWDIRRSESLLRARIKAKGMLVPTRFDSKSSPAPSKPLARDIQGSAADDCSIAAKIKAMAGAEIATFGSEFQAAGADHAPKADAAVIEPPGN